MSTPTASLKSKAEQAKAKLKEKLGKQTKAAPKDEAEGKQPAGKRIIKSKAHD